MREGRRGGEGEQQGQQEPSCTAGTDDSTPALPPRKAYAGSWNAEGPEPGPGARSKPTWRPSASGPPLQGVENI
jgi:hypothetical protein